MELPGLELLDAERSMPLMRLPVRAIVAELATARVLISPASTLGPDRLRSIGEVTDIVAPNLLHTEGVALAAPIHPKARLWGPRGIAKKLPSLTWSELGTDAWPYEDELALVTLAGMPAVKESVFVHRKSRSLVATDLVFNIEDPKGIGPWVILSIFGTHGRFGVSRLFAKMAKDRAAFEASLATLLAHDFVNVVPSHGAVAYGSGKERLAQALRERGFRAERGP